MIMGAIMLNVWVAALFYDPVEKHMKKVPKQAVEDAEDLEEPNETSLLHKPKFVISTEDNSASMHQLPKTNSFVDNTDITKNSFVRSASSAAVPTYKGQSSRERKVSVPVGMARSGFEGSRSYINSNSTLNAVPEGGLENGMSLQSQTRLHLRRPKRSPSTSSFQYISTPYHGSTLNLSPEVFTSTFSLRSSKSVTKIGEKQEAPPKKKLFDLSLLKDPLYLIILISNCTNAISYTNFIILLPKYGEELKFDTTQSALLLSIVSSLDLVGRIGGSAVSDLGFIPKAWYFVGGLFVSGVALFFLPFFSTYSAVSAFCAIFGLGSGVYVGVTAVIMADMLGTERLQSSYGISLFVNGILQLIGPPICGLWFVKTGSFYSLFCTLGAVLVLGASLWGFVPCIRRKKVEKPDNNDLS